MLTALVIAACGTPPAQPTAERPADAAASQGQALFALNCGECHGDDGSGTDEAPAVLGHTVQEVLKQVREPAGDMDAIPPDKLSDADLRLIAEFAAVLGGEEAHATDIEPTGEERIHLEAAYEAIEDHENMDREMAITHLEQAVALSSGEAGELYEKMLESIKAEKAGNARHELKTLLGLVEER
jgi:cytochrome c553